MSLLQGDPLPSIKTTKDIETTGPEWYTDYLENLATVGTDYLGKTGAELVAGFDPMQEEVFKRAQGALTSYQPDVDLARGTYSNLSGGIDKSRIDAFLNPYTESVVDEMARLSQQNMQRNLLPTLKGAFTATGGAGSQRMLGALGQMGADVAANLSGQQMVALQDAYNKAMDAAFREADVERLGAAGLLDTGMKEQQMAQTALEKLLGYGTLKQQQEQAEIMAPLTTAGSVGNLFANLKVPSTVSEEAFGPIPGAYSTSPLAQIAGLSSLFAAAPGGTSAFSNVLGAGKDFASFLSGFGSGGGGLAGGAYTTIYDNLDPDA